MSVYDINGNQLNSIYSINETSLSSAYDINGNEIFSGIPTVDPMDWSAMPSIYRRNIDSSLSYINTYIGSHTGSYAISQFNDIHMVFSQNEPNYVEYNKTQPWSRILFLGDMANSHTEANYTSALAYMNQVVSPKIVAMGNHEYGFNYVEGNLNPTEQYKSVLSGDEVYWHNDNAHGLIYYSDDDTNNVRYIVLDYFWVTQNQDGHSLDLDQLEWLASVMEATTSKDIIICAHTTISPFILVDTGEEKSSANRITNVAKLIELIDAFKERSTYTVNTSHDFSNCQGDFIMYASGHYHKPGCKTTSYDFNMFTGPAMSTYEAIRGITFYLVNPLAKKIIWLIAYRDSEGIGTLEFTY